MAHLVREQWKLPYISAYEDLCRSQLPSSPDNGRALNGGCPLYAEPGVPMNFDMDHFTAQGSIVFARAIRARNQLP